MDTQELQAFMAIADSGGFSRAAEQLHLTQSAISKRIAALEQGIGHRLFDRIGRRVSLTDAGRTLLPYARESLSAIGDGRRALSRLGSQVAGRLSIGTSHHIGLHRLPLILSQYTQEFPDVDLDIHFMDSEVACDAVLAGQLELGIVTLPKPVAASLETLRIWPDPLSLVVGRSHAWAKRRTLSVETLADMPAVLPDEATYTHRIIREALADRGVSPRVRLASNYLETLKMLVSIGLGWSVLPSSMVDDSLHAIEIRGLSLHRELGAVWHRSRTLSGAAEMLRARLLDSVSAASAPASVRSQ